jgi:hypothetical protein
LDFAKEEGVLETKTPKGCEIPAFAKAIGHEDKWLLHKGLKKSSIGQKLDFANHSYLCKDLLLIIKFTGDIVFNDRMLGIGPAKDFQSWMNVFEKMASSHCAFFPAILS